MKAWMLNGIGDIRLVDADVPEPAKNEVLIKVMAAGICGSDIPRIYETGAHVMPLIPGHEFSGTVAGTGSDAHAAWMDKRVAVYPKIPCGTCSMCAAGMPDMCMSYDYVGSRRDGAFAEYVAVPADRLIELPDNISFETGAMLEPLAVAGNAVRTAGCGAGFSSGMSAVVCGMGTIGLMTVMLLKDAGIDNIYVIGNKDIQRNKAGMYGAGDDRFCDSRNEDPVSYIMDRTDGRGADLYIECVGSNESIGYGIDAAAPGGHVILVGNPRSDVKFSRDTYWKILRRQIRLSGIWNSSFRQHTDEGGQDDDWHYVLKRLAAGNAEPEKLITHRFPIEDLDKGIAIMRDRTEDFTKIMMINN